MDSSSSSSQSQNWEHHVFVSFRGADVREGFLSHLLKELRSKAIDPFIDNEMERGSSINPELKKAIKGSRIAIVLVSENYASSSWCLDELVKIIKYRKKFGQKVITIFYRVEPTDVKKQAGEFGKVFKKNCKGKTYEVIRKWREALAEVATIAGYDSRNWVDEASAIEKISIDISEMLNHLASSYYLDRFIGMKAHMDKMQPYLRFDLVKEVRMIGIWGPPGIGKSTICRSLFNQFSNNFRLKAIMVNIKQSYPNPCLDEGSAQLQLQNDMLSKMINHKDIVITYLGAAQDRLKDKKVLLVLDDVDQHAQLVALAEDNHWFGSGSRIIIATEDLRVLLAHGIDLIYRVEYPSSDAAFQIFCMYAFPQKSPDDGFTKFAREITYLVGNLPLGLQIMGSYFLRRPKYKWIEALPKLRSCLDGNTESILKFNYDALNSSLAQLLSSIGNATNHQKLYIDICRNIEKLPSSVGYATNLQNLNLSECSSLAELPSMENATNLQKLDLTGGSSFPERSYSIGNITSLENLHLSHCSSFVKLPSSIGNCLKLERLTLKGCLKLEVLDQHQLDIINLTGHFVLKKTSLNSLVYVYVQ